VEHSLAISDACLDAARAASPQGYHWLCDTAVGYAAMVGFSTVLGLIALQFLLMSLVPSIYHWIIEVGAVLP